MDTQTEVMTQVTALKLAQKAIAFLLTGTPTIDTFDIDEMDAGFDLLFAQKRARKGNGRHPNQATLDTAQGALRKIYWRLYGIDTPDTPLSRMGRGGRQKPKLEAAALALPEIIAKVEAEYNAYWVEFAAAVMEEAEAILAGVGRVEE